ncbi:MAG: hypothetical protein ACFE85_07960 [Candidatus Hodarchaeota archaeon]
MNEISILMHLLSRRKKEYQIGATKKEILSSLNIKGKNKPVYFHDLITNLSNYVKPLGIQVQYNPLNSHWFISFDSEISDLIFANPFEGEPRLAATLLCVLICSLQDSGITTIQKVNKIRKKKSILDDLKELRKKGYIFLNKENGKITLTPLIGYQLDIHKLFTKLALKLKE